jgi:predicted  nucleic acid-binding Zn-ribbon protein
MTEASRVQKMLTEQNEWIDKLKSQIMRLELDIVGYRTRNKQLETALRELSDGWECCPVSQAMRRVAREALEGKDE